MEEYNNILTKLKSISLIKEEDTYSTVSEEPILHNSWSSFFYRRYNRENPGKTIQYIKEVLYSALRLINECNDNEEKNEIKSLLTDALKGFSNLKITYKNYSDTVIDINNILNDINTHMLDNCVLTDDVSGELYINDKDKFFNNLYESKYDEISKYLYDGNDVNIINDEGKNALHIVCDKKYYNKEIFKLIMSFNINLMQKDDKGFTPLDCAVNTNCSEAVVDIELQKILENKKKTRVINQ